MTISATELSYLQADLAISTDEAVFTDTELDTLWTRASEDHDGSLVLALRQLLMDATKFNDYTSGQTSEKRSQVYDHLKDRLTYYEDIVVRGGNQIVIAGMRSVPPIYKEVPAGEEYPDLKTRRHNSRYSGRWRGEWD